MSTSPDRRKAFVTGIGAVSPLGLGAERLHERWAAGTVGISDGLGRARDFDPAEHLSVKEARRLDRFAQFALVAAGEALAQAGFVGGMEEGGVDPYRVACVIATGIGGQNTVETQLEVMRERGARQVSPLGIPQYMPNAAAAAITMKHGIRGQSFQVGSACASGAHGIGLALRMIQYGEADVVVCGGTEATLTEFAAASFLNMQAMSATGISRPFDLRRDGFVMGEGAGVLVLEAAESAAARGVTALAEIAGYGSTTDAHHLTAPDPSGTPASRAVELALADAGAGADDVDYINAHGTSTQLNDAAETEAIKRALGEARAHAIPVSSTKSTIGHLLGAAGAVEAVATVRTLVTGVVGPTLGYEVPDPALDLDYVPGESRPLSVPDGRPALALSNSFAFGGHNVTLAIRGAAS